MQENYEPMRETTANAPRRNKWAIPLATLGVLAIAAAAILSWVVVPGRKQLPADTNITRQLSGTAAILLNPQAIATGDLGNALLSNVPVTAERSVKALATDGGTAEVSDTRILKTATGQELGKSEANYAVDRKTLEASKTYPSDWKVVPHEGLTVSWPIGAEKKDYTAWINETKSTTPVKFVRTEKKADVDTYVYEASSAAAPIKDEQVLAALPKALPQAALAALMTRLPLTDAQKAAAAQALPSLGDPVPLNYTYEVKSTYWVEPTTGLVVDTKREEVRKAVIAGPLQAPVYDVDTGFTDQSVAAAAKDATDKKNSINTASKTIPLWLLILGLIALLAGLAGWFMGRRRQEPAAATTTGQRRPADRRPPDGDDDARRDI
jgi:LPXTG-motif cell wall-anchored protein